MRVMRVYADTSVFGAIADEEFAEHTRRFFARLQKGQFLLLVSTELLRELVHAPEVVRDSLSAVSPHSVETVLVGQEVEALADAYIAGGVIGPKYRADAIHVAAATIARADLILSWNFKHIVNLDRIGKYNAINVLHGHKPVEIRSPAEVVYEDEDT